MKKKDFKQWTKGMDKSQLKAELMNELENLDHMKREIEVVKDCWQNTLKMNNDLKKKIEELEREKELLEKDLFNSLNKLLDSIKIRNDLKLMYEKWIEEYKENLEKSIFSQQSPTDIWKERFEKEEEMEKAQNERIKAVQSMDVYEEENKKRINEILGQDINGNPV